MSTKNKNTIELELKNKVYFLQKALEECSNIMDKIKTENESLKQDCDKILSQGYSSQDLSKIRGD